jgi:hypothetical protein
MGDDWRMSDDAGGETAKPSRHIGIGINRSAAEVYRYAADPSRLPDWAAGLASAELRPVGPAGIPGRGRKWVTQSPMGEITIEFTPENNYGILDHTVTLPSGEAVFNPMRVIAIGPVSSEVVFSLRRRPGMSDDDFEMDAKAVAADLAALREILER